MQLTSPGHAACMQIRSHAPDADIIVLGMPENVNAALGRPAAYIGNVTVALADLQGGGFQKLTYLPIPASVMQVLRSEHCFCSRPLPCK